jgi:RNA polymerase sigma factor (TIGR02999 family)
LGDHLRYDARMGASTTLTGRLRLYSGGDRNVADAILEEIFPRLREIAARRLSRERCTPPVTPTELIGETWLSSLHRGKWVIANREHFFSIAGLAMEHVLIDMARKRLAQRRGQGAMHVSIEDISPSQEPVSADAEEILAIAMLLGKLESSDAKSAFVVRMHYIAGFTLQEIAEHSGWTLRQVRHRWEKGKVWLASRLSTRKQQFLADGASSGI